MYNTRFNPTTNGPLHLGHVMNLLVNMTEAHNSGGKCTLRFDDTQAVWLWKVGVDQCKRYADQMRDDLAWLGIVPDHWSAQSEMLEQERDLVEKWFHMPLPDMKFDHIHAAQVAGLSNSFTPYSRRFTMDHVAFDFLEGINLVIRGWDLMTEDCLYAYFCDEWGIKYPETRYIPRLYFNGQTVSKTACTFKIEDFRKAGMDPHELLCRLKNDCLRWDNSDWTISQLKSYPIELGDWAKEALWPS
jgi:glutamyl/glutaminyl-tRNA synthetase